MVPPQSINRRTSQYFVVALLGTLLILGSLPLLARNQSTDSSSSQQKPQQQAPPEAGGPQGDVGPIIVPKKKPEDEPPPPPRREVPKNPEGMPNFSLRVDVPNVQIPVMVTTKDGGFIPGLKKENFKVLEDGVPQNITNFNVVADAPITAVLLVEFASNNYYFMYDALNASYSFANTLKPDDWIAVISYDMKPTIISDFTQDKRAVYGALNQLRIPGFSETNMFDALYDTIDRVDRIEGRKYIILISTGIDTFSKLNWDKVQQKLKDTRNVTVFTVSTGEALRLWYEARYGNSPYYGEANLNFLQADNQMNTIAKMTGGKWYHPRFEGELKDIFGDIGAEIRNQYVITYKPTNTKQDGSFRKLKIELQAADGGPLTIKDQKGKQIKPVIVARDGYTAKHEVE